MKSLCTFCQVPHHEHRVTRSTRKKLNGVISTHPQTDQMVPIRRKQGTRRKAQDSSSYMIDKYIDGEVIILHQGTSNILCGHITR